MFWTLKENQISIKWHSLLLLSFTLIRPHIELHMIILIYTEIQPMIRSVECKNFNILVNCKHLYQTQGTIWSKTSQKRTELQVHSYHTHKHTSDKWGKYTQYYVVKLVLLIDPFCNETLRTRRFFLRRRLTFGVIERELFSFWLKISMKIDKKIYCKIYYFTLSQSGPKGNF